MEHPQSLNFIAKPMRIYVIVQSILKEINPEYSLERLMLKLQYFGHLMQRANSLEKTLMLRKMEGRRRRAQQKMRWLDGITYSWMWIWANSVENRGDWHVAKSRTWLCDWMTATTIFSKDFHKFPRNQSLMINSDSSFHRNGWVYGSFYYMEVDTWLIFHSHKLF